jgi:hypothetical protein
MLNGRSNSLHWNGSTFIVGCLPRDQARLGQDRAAIEYMAGQEHLWAFAPAGRKTVPTIFRATLAGIWAGVAIL